MNATQQTAARVVPCPTCAKPVAWSPENRYRPFCSDRCRQIDLGAWASGAYRVPAAAGGEGSGEPADDPDAL